MMTTTESIFAIANERMGIIAACNDIGMDLPDYDYGSMKLYCPFGDIYHMDGGTSKSFRVYPMTNTAYCFACAESYNPVKLISMARGIEPYAAAEAILEETGYVPPDFSAQWDAIMETIKPIDTDSLAEALKLACERMNPNWETLQFDDEVARIFQKCLSVLGKVTTDDDAAKWLSTAREVMRNVLGDTK